MEGIFTKIGIDPGIVIIAILITMLVLILIVLVLLAKVRDISRKYTNFMRGEDGKSLEKSVERRFQEIGTVVRAQNTLTNRQQFVEAVQNRSLTRYGIVKYDAFDDVGGKLSFALAMLDNSDTGFVLNAIHSKENCFLYLKEIVKGESYIMLSHEEIQALRSAKKFGAEEDAIMKYQLDRAVRAEKKSVTKLQEMKKPPTSAKPRSTAPAKDSANVHHTSSHGTANASSLRDEDTIETINSASSANVGNYQHLQEPIKAAATANIPSEPAFASYPQEVPKQTEEAAYSEPGGSFGASYGTYTSGGIGSDYRPYESKGSILPKSSYADIDRKASESVSNVTSYGDSALAEDLSEARVEAEDSQLSSPTETIERSGTGKNNSHRKTGKPPKKRKNKNRNRS